MDNNKIDQLLESFGEMKKLMDTLSEKVETMEKRLGKVDSIEHRVTSNQIDITDIKEALERMEEVQGIRMENALKEMTGDMDKKNLAEFKTIHKRLDSHLLKLGRVEEDILILKEES
jgi:tetrahydromethanopterin S-methyltransferase subunit G